MIKLEKHRDVLFSTLLEITSLIIGGKDKRAIFHKLVDGCLVALEAERVYLLEMDDRGLVRHWKSRRPGGEMQVEVVSDSSSLLNWMSLESARGTRLHRGEELAFDLPLLASQCIGIEDRRMILSAPLVGKRTFFGLLIAIHGSEGETYSRDDEQLLTVLANHAAIALENRLLYQQLEREAITDGLTGVHNYRFLITTLENEIKRARRFKQTFSFVMLDVDNLKEFNDTRGHLAGSQALKEVATIVKANCRDIDFVSKYGGDEFGIILPQTQLEGAVVVARRVLEAVREHTFDKGVRGLLTCSAGISLFPRDGETVRQVISSADKALYEAKRAGKNLVLSTDDLAKKSVK